MQTKDNALKNLAQLFNLAKNGARSSHLFKLNNALLQDKLKLYNLVADLKAEDNSHVEHLEIQSINHQIQNLFDKIVSLNYLINSQDKSVSTQNLTREIERELAQISNKLS